MFINFVRNKSKKFISMTMVLLMLCAFMIPVSAGEVLTLNYEEADIYFVDDDMKAVVGELPEGYNSSVQLEANYTDSLRWYVSSGSSVTVDSTGLVTPRTETWYWYGNMGVSSPIAGKEPTSVEVSYVRGESVVTCERNGERVNAVIEVCDYSDVYVNNKIQEYLDSNITESMTDYEKLDKVCKYVAGFEYSPYYSSYKSMVLQGGGDCWASASLITHICNDFLGIPAAIRYGVNDPGAAGGHRNAVVYIDGKYYAAEAGYSTPAPRFYHITELEDGFSLKNNTSGYVAYQYDGQDSNVVFPETYNNSPVTEIGASVFYYNNWADFKPESVTIPASVKVIDKFAFSGIESIENIYVDENNAVYCSVDGVVYTKDKSFLLTCPSGKEGVLNVVEGTKTIGDYAIAYNGQITEINVPEGVETIGEGAFGDCTKLVSVSLPDTLKVIDEFAFYNTYKLTELYIPASVTQMGDNVFSDTEQITIYGEEGSFAQEYAQSKGIRFAIKKLGDTEQDGDVNIKDATAIQKYLAMLIEFSAIQKDVADFNGDGSVSISDATAIQKMLAGLEY